MADILFKTDDAVFSYRVAGVMVQNGKVLLQRPADVYEYAFPGGHAEFFETNAQTLMREFREEMGAEITVGNLMWVGEIFFPWGKKPCHQICLYYKVEPVSGIPLDRNFHGTEQLENLTFKLHFEWHDIDQLSALEVYPPQCREFLKLPEDQVQHFIYHET